MKLTSKRVALELAHPWKIARTESTSKVEVVIVEFTGPNGVIGLGEAAPVSRYHESAESVEAFLSRIDLSALSPTKIRSAIDYVNAIGQKHYAAKCAFETALLDWHCKSLQVPLYKWLRLDFQESARITSFTIGLDDPGIIKSKVIDSQEFPILKMKVGVPGDRENLAALREVAPTKTIRVDANEGWRTKEQALEMIEWLAEDSHIQFVEQPLPESTSVADWKWLKERSPLPIFGDESYHTAADVERAAECFHGVNVKLVKTGGVLGAFDALQAARKAGLKTMLGCMIETSVLISAAAHLAGLCDYIDLDGNLLITNDPYSGVITEHGILSFAKARTHTGLCVSPR